MASTDPMSDSAPLIHSDRGHFVGNSVKLSRCFLAEDQDGGTCFLVSFIAKFFPEAFSDKHLERREAGNDHHEQDKRGIVPCRARHQPEHRNADIKNHQ